MSFNLLVDPFAPFLTLSGAIRWLTVPQALSGLHDGDHAVEPAWPRADLDTATWELLIGVLSFAMPPATHDDWRARYAAPPSAEDVGTALAPLVPAFNVDGDGPRFMQELGLDGDPNPVEALLIDTPGANGQKKNADLLTHRDRYGGLCLPAAAIALYALNAFAPAGGAGIRTSMRGGGPLTALVIPQGGADGAPLPLWHRLWANVVEKKDAPPPPDSVFAWLRTDLPVGKERGAAEIHQGQQPFDARLHPFFGMPRRVRLVIGGRGRCAMTGIDGPLVTGFVQKPYGLNYGQWRHPLTPYRRQKAMEPSYSTKPKSGRFGYRDWVATIVGDANDDEKALFLAAENVRRARHDRADTLSDGGMRAEARVRVAGWAMNNMEAISYLVAEEPLHVSRDPNASYHLDRSAHDMATAGDIVAGALRQAVRVALGVDGDGSVVEQARSAFYERTEDEFHDILFAVVLDPEIRDEAPASWLRAMRRAALELFDLTCPVPIEDAQKGELTVKARAGLRWTLLGWGKSGKALFDALHLPTPRGRKTAEEEPA